MMNEAPSMKVTKLRWLSPDSYLIAAVESSQEKYRVEAVLNEKPKRLTLSICDENARVEIEPGIVLEHDDPMARKLAMELSNMLQRFMSVTHKGTLPRAE